MVEEFLNRRSENSNGCKSEAVGVVCVSLSTGHSYQIGTFDRFIEFLHLTGQNGLLLVECRVQLLQSNEQHNSERNRSSWTRYLDQVVFSLVDQLPIEVVGFVDIVLSFVVLCLNP